MAVRPDLGWLCWLVVKRARSRAKTRQMRNATLCLFRGECFHRSEMKIFD